MTEKLLVATHNKGKVAELAEILSDLAIDFLTLDDLLIAREVAETGATLAENAILKARAYADEATLLTLADDSGLEVDALGGAPGVHTARYGGPEQSPQERYLLLLRNLQDVPWDERAARFRCVIALADASGTLLGTAEGVVEGWIAPEPAGEGGFGYDPVFYVPEHGRTMAQLPAELKNRISHRARALAAIEPLLRRALEGP